MNIDVINILVTTILTGVGLYLAHSYQRQVGLRVAEKRIVAYSAMWSKMIIATPVRIAPWQKNKKPLKFHERKKLFDELTE